MTHLNKHDIKEFNSLDEIISFQKKYSNYREIIISNHTNLLVQEKNNLEIDIQQIEKSITTERNYFKNKQIQQIEDFKHKLNEISSSSTKSYVQKLTKKLKEWYYSKKIEKAIRDFDSRIESSIKHLKKSYIKKYNRYQYLVANFKEAVQESYRKPIKELERKKEIIDELRKSIHGALGELQVVKKLEQLSDDYFLINDFCLSWECKLNCVNS